MLASGICQEPLSKSSKPQDIEVIKEIAINLDRE